MDILSMVNVHKRFGDKTVLQDLNLSVPQGSVFGFIGKNGAGKTTAMKIVLGLLEAEQGDTYIFQEKVRYGNTHPQVGYLPDVPAFYSHLNAYEYLKLCAQLCNMQPANRDTRILELLNLVGLENEKHRIKGFSRGMKQRLGIAQALLHRPKLLICDEPTSALDPIGRKEILDILQAVRAETTIFFSTHILSDIERVCTHVAFLHEGKAIIQKPLADLKKMHVYKGYLIETMQVQAADMLQQTFKQLQRTGTQTLMVSKDEDALLFRILQFISDHKIAIRKLEQMEPDLESLFLEVTQQ